MSQISTELSHINEQRWAIKKDLQSKEIDKKTYYDLDLRYLNASGKLINAAISLVVSAAKHGSKVKNMAEKINLLDATAINTGNPEIEMIKCPNSDHLISRSECLDYSGSHNKECAGCYHKKLTQNKLLGEAA